MSQPRFGSFVLAVSVGLWVVSDGVGVAVPLPKPSQSGTRTVRWTVREPFVSNEPHDPLVVKDMVIVGTDRGALQARRCKDGELLWAHEHGKRIFHRPCSDGKQVYFASPSGVTAVTIEEGAKVWSFDAASCDGPMMVLEKLGLVYVGGNDGHLYALDTKSGEERWRCDFVSDAPADPPHLPGMQARLRGTRARPTALVSDGETLFLSVFDQGRVIAVNATTGKQLWSFQARGWVYGAAVATEKHVFFGSQDKAFYCLDKKTGKKLWSRETKGGIESGGAVDDKFVYFGSCDGGLYCLNQSDGKERWRFAIDRLNGNSAIYSVPILLGARAYFAAGEGQAYAVDRQTGKLKWKARPSKGSDMYCSPASDGALFFFVTRAKSKKVGDPPGPTLGAPSLVAIGVKR